MSFLGIDLNKLKAQPAQTETTAQVSSYGEEETVTGYLTEKDQMASHKMKAMPMQNNLKFKI